MVSKWEKVFFIAVILIVISLVVFHKQVRLLFAENSRQEQVLNADKQEKKDKKSKKDKDEKDNKKKNNDNDDNDK